MDFQSLKGAMRRDSDFPRRVFELQALARVRDGQQYDHLGTPFSDERSASGEYIPMAQRRPSVRSNLCAVITSNIVSLLFSEDHFPSVQASNPTTLAMLEDLIKHTRLHETMITAALIGSVGSVVLWLRVLKNRPYLQALETTFLTPCFDPAAPDTLLSVTEKYKVEAADLIERGYDVDPKAGAHWFQRIWDTSDELWFIPKPVAVPGPMHLDSARSTKHSLGICPMLWVKNLPGSGVSEYEGACTFINGVDTVIELDYLLSQGGRGLKYASDPTLVIRSSEAPAAHAGGAANALVLPEIGDAKLLEISGGAANAVLEHCKTLRELALEAMAGVRTAPERIVGATSGKAMEMLHQPTIFMADRLRITYGESALINLFQMVCKASQVVPGGLLIADTPYANVNPAGIGLRWGAWFAATPHDELETSQALQFLIQNEIVSRETATRTVAGDYDIEDVDAERVLITSEAAEQEQRQADLAIASAPPKPSAIND